LRYQHAVTNGFVIPEDTAAYQDTGASCGRYYGFRSWTRFGNFCRESVTSIKTCAGKLTGAGTITFVRITGNGTDTFRRRFN
jgi:hypothetical protein